MTDRQTIVVLGLGRPLMRPGTYLMDHLCSVWQEQGYHVCLQRGLDGPLPEAEVAIQHVDLTVVPEAYTKAVARYPVVLNRHVTDISKRLFSSLIVGPADGYEGPVIIKTNANYGGQMEVLVRHMQGERGPSPPLPWPQGESLKEYPVFASVRDVPEEVWSNSHLIVEKFLPERVDADSYCLRVWLFLGDRELHYRSISTAPVVKSRTTIRREYLDVEDVPQALRTVRKRLGFDYGKFDYALQDGRAVLFDVNKTPSVPQGYRAEAENRERLEHLSMGIEYFLERFHGNTGHDN